MSSIDNKIFNAAKMGNYETVVRLCKECVNMAIKGAQSVSDSEDKNTTIAKERAKIVEWAQSQFEEKKIVEDDNSDYSDYEGEPNEWNDAFEYVYDGKAKSLNELLNKYPELATFFPRNNSSLLHMAISERSASCVKTLLKHGAKMSTKDYSGHDAWWSLKMNPNKEVQEVVNTYSS